MRGIINYKDSKRFHISLGLALVVLGYISMFGYIWCNMNEFKEFNNVKSSETLRMEGFDQKFIDSYASAWAFRKSALIFFKWVIFAFSLFLVICGMIIFWTGYKEWV